IFISQRDLTDPAIRDAAMNFIFPNRPATIDDVRKIINDHVTAAAEAEKNHETAAAEAHRKYAEYLTSLMTSKGNDNLADQALAALSQLAGSTSTGGGQDTGDAAAAGAAAGASTGNPYVAIATFLIKGIAWKDSSNADTFQMSTLRTANWSETQTREFNAIIANQVTASYTVTQSEFPQYHDFVKVRTDKTPETGPPPSTKDVINTLKAQLQEELNNDLSTLKNK
ncbi:MAG: hypothetical protein WA183_04770, partial [Chthoniobacterales bacterium]